jgi:hypothetical protein
VKSDQSAVNSDQLSVNSDQLSVNSEQSAVIRVKLLLGYVYLGGVYAIGDVLSVPADTAKQWIEEGIAAPLSPPPLSPSTETSPQMPSEFGGKKAVK